MPPPRTRRATTIANVVDAFAEGTASRILDMKKIKVPMKKNPIRGRPIGSRLIVRPLRSPDIDASQPPMTMAPSAQPEIDAAGPMTRPLRARPAAAAPSSAQPPPAGAGSCRTRRGSAAGASAATGGATSLSRYRRSVIPTTPAATNRNRRSVTPASSDDAAA